MPLYTDILYPEAEACADATFIRAWELVGPIFGLSGNEVHDRFVAAHTKAIIDALNKAYRAGCLYGDEQAKDTFCRDE